MAFQWLDIMKYYGGNILANIATGTDQHPLSF